MSKAKINLLLDDRNDVHVAMKMQKGTRMDHCNYEDCMIIDEKELHDVSSVTVTNFQNVL